MKNFKQLFLSIVCLAVTSLSVNAQQDSTGMPGDHFSLQGALEMFRQSTSPEEFEKLINVKDNHVNNLDLNGDGETDYIKVIDKAGGNAHAFVLQVAVSETENQDIAVIELEKTGDTTAVLQIIGDEDIFGEEVIVEASDEGDEVTDDNEGQASGPSAGFYEPIRLVVNVFFWPCVRHVYRPVYVPWVSPWRWHQYPGWWKPWRPVTWRVFHPLRLRYHRHYAVVRTHRVVVAHRIYTPFRVRSVTVRTRTTVVRNYYRVNQTRRTNVIRDNNRNNNNNKKARSKVKRRKG